MEPAWHIEMHMFEQENFTPYGRAAGVRIWTDKENIIMAETTSSNRGAGHTRPNMKNCNFGILVRQEMKKAADHLDMQV